MKDAAEVGSVAMIYIPSFIKTGSAIQKSKEGGGGRFTGTQTAWGSYKPTFTCENKENGLKMEQEIFTRG
jgi:hypothetical protein